jgi:hypothetical protein
MIHPNTAWLIGMSVWTAVLGGTIHTAVTGKMPQSLKDFVYPVIDRAAGIRASLPTYWRDIVHLAHDPVGYVTSSLTGQVGRIADVWQNKNFYGNEIYNPDDPLAKRWEDAIKHQFPMPFSVSSFSQSGRQGGNTLSRVAGYLGAPVAPRWIDETDAERLAFEYAMQHREVGSRTQVAADRSQARNDVLHRLEHGEQIDASTDPQFQQAVQRGLLRPQDLAPLVKESHIPQLVRQIASPRLNVAESLNVYDLATPDEKAQIQVAVRRKLIGAMTKPWEWTGDSAAKAQKYFGIKPAKVAGLAPVPTALTPQ